MLVVLWTAFSVAFSSVMSTLFIPLSLAALGIVLRGSGFAFHKMARRLRNRQLAERVFGLSSVVTPFFMGTVVGAIASGRVPVGNAAGDAVTSWLNAPSLLTGALFVATGAYLSAVFLVSDARRAGDPDLERYFSARALGAGLVTGAIALAGILVYRADARFIYDGLTSEGLPLVIVSAACGLGSADAALAGCAAGDPPARRRGRGGRDLGLGGRAVPVPASADPDDRGRRGGGRDPDRGADRVRDRGRGGAAGARIPLHARPAEHARRRGVSATARREGVIEERRWTGGWRSGT